MQSIPSLNILLRSLLLLTLCGHSLAIANVEASWRNLGAEPGPNGNVQALAVDSNQVLYAGGAFTTTGGVSANRIAQWDGSNWSAIGTGMSKDGTFSAVWVSALVVDVNGHVYAGGNFTYADGITVNNIAIWDGSSWNALGSGMNADVKALALDGDGNLYAGGNFTTAGGVAASRVAKWNGSTWHALGDGMNHNGTVEALTVDTSGNLYAGGWFTSAGGVAGTSRIAKWDGNTWSALGTGMNQEVLALTFDHGGQLVAGGRFTLANGVTANKIARWNGSHWNALGSGIGTGEWDRVRTIACDDLGNLYAAGEFSSAGGVAASNIAKWDGSNWTALDSGLNQIAYTLATDAANNVYAGGIFTSAGGEAISNLAKWQVQSDDPILQFFDDFDPDYDPALWASFGAIAEANTHGQAAGPGSNGNSLWFGGNGSRFATTIPLDASAGGEVSFSFALSNGQSFPWENADWNEYVVLEYSLNGVDFVLMGGPYSNRTWQQIIVSIPEAAQTESTRFRFRQLTHSGAPYDHWAIDDVAITAISTPPNTPPLAMASFSVVDAQSGEVILDASGSSDPDGTITDYTWAWNGSSATGVNPSVHLPQGSTTVTLTVTDDRGAEDSISFSVFVGAGEPVSISDPQLEAALRTALSKPTDTLTNLDLESLNSLDLSGLGIASLSGLEYATNLRILDLRNNPLNDALAVWAILDQLTFHYLALDSRRPDSDPAGLLTREFTTNSGQALFVSIDTANFPTWDISALAINSTRTHNVAALLDFLNAGVTIDTGGLNLPPAAAADYTVINALAGEVELDGSASSDLEGEITNYVWSWTGGSASGMNPTVMLPGSLTYVTLAVTDTGGSTTEFTFLIVFPSPLEIAQQAYLKASNSGSGDQFGYAVAISGDTVVVGAPYEQSSSKGVNSLANNEAANAGAVYVFVRNGEIWNEQGYLKASNAQAGDWFGWSVGISGDTLVVGAIGEDSAATGVNGDSSNNDALNSGAAYLFVRNNGIWAEQAYLKASNAETNDQFGRAVAISGNTVVVGARWEDSASVGANGDASNNSASNSGAAYVFVRNGSLWSQQAYLKASNTGAGDLFGHAVAISADTIVVGAYEEDSNAIGLDGDASNNSASNSGAAYVFVRHSGIWSQEAYLKASNTGASDWFGYAVDISGDTVVVGAHQEDGNARVVNGDGGNNSRNSSGAAYVFVRNTGTWSQQAYLKAFNADFSDSFGYSVAISGERVLVGAYRESSSALGVENAPGLQSTLDNSATNAGAAYTFIRNGNDWTPQSYLKASNTGANEYYGFAVALSGDTWVTGANQEKSSTKGVNSAPDKLASNAGSAYIAGFRPLGANLAPIARADYEILDAESGLVALDASASVDPDGTIMSYDWSWFGGSASGMTGSATLPPAETFITLTVTDDLGGTHEQVFSVSLLTPLEIAQQAYLKASNTNEGERFGYAVAVSGDTVVVGLPFESSSTSGIDSTPNSEASAAGAAYVFVRHGNTWNEQAYLKASNSGAGDNFGVSVAISGDTIVVGACYEDSSTTGVNSNPDDNVANSGAAYVFVRSGSSWSQEAYLKAANADAGDNFGLSVALSGDTVLVGAGNEASSTPGVNSSPDNNAVSAGAAYVFVRNAGLWTQEAYLKASNAAAYHWFGEAVAISGDTLVVGARGERSTTSEVNSLPNNSGQAVGAAYVFVRSEGNWSQQAYLKAFNPAWYQNFGGAVAISGGTIVVGATGENSSTTGVNSTPNNSASSSGAAYVFVRSGEIWAHNAYLKASNTDPGDAFGVSVAISGESIVVGATFEDSNSIGVNSSPNEEASNAGAAYLFQRNGHKWSQQAYLKPSNPGSGDSFGAAVAVSGTVIVVGAVGEDSASTGINSEPDEAASNAGAAYIFTDPDISSPTLADFTAAAGLSGDDALPMATPFSDGVPNLLKYAFNMDLAGPDSHQMTPGGSSGLPGGGLVEESGQTYWRVEYVRRKNSDLIYTPQKSSTLAQDSFVPMSGAQSVADIPGAPDWERVTIDEPCDPATEDRCFSRVRVDIL